ncbi:malate dehydrogenase [Thermoproteus tenax]|uniref:Malate dehydrogenase n=1 Tax=Thermoproteus tenax (strain ATCC 35583 / DSM 2078 / JCM 9277 / NBRC 100435 / Kra 1) TaxID=768679 RepID=MDH_THETK|nr:malate dehydrogenase [Thermoproteus tenax]Q704B2.1 RecName: Full=Malate dehydrogenase [Thermoproteus tenax Kra 1]CAF18482.1 malate dehydrogenase [Thermoproteus tenax]CCC82058.1 malate dehydrogenase [Thermoproteus tenax Kra 1]
MITVVGSGRVGATTAAMLGVLGVDNKIVLIDIIKGLPQGEALDLNHMSSILGLDVYYTGSNDYADMKGSDLVIVTAGLARKPGMTREQLLEQNAQIVANIGKEIAKYAPDSVVILTTNPLDAMTYVMWRATGFSRERVVGFSGVLDGGRLAFYAGQKLGISPASIIPIVLGQHGESMFPVPSKSFVFGVPLDKLLKPEEIKEAVEETVKAGARITELRGFSSNWAPGAGVAIMAKAVKRDERRALIASVVLDGEYGVRGIPVEVPVVLGRGGAIKVLEVELSPEEKQRFQQSVEAISKLLNSLPAQYK